MHLAPNPSSLVWLGIAMRAGIAASVTIWSVAIARWSMGMPVVRYQPRRPVPWRGRHILLMILFYLALAGAAHMVVSHIWPTEVATQGKVDSPGTEHPIVKMVQAAHGNPWVLLAAVLAAVVVAPVAEEFFFRVLLQGWLEAAERRHRRRLRWLSRFLPGAAPIALSSLLFAALHIRIGEAPPPPAMLVIAGAIAELLAMAGIILLLRARCGATAVDFGWVSEKLAADASIGTLAVVAVAPLLYLLQFLAQKTLEHFYPLAKVAAAPLPLFFIALVLGTFFYRTHRLAPSITTHAALNATTLAISYWAT